MVNEDMFAILIPHVNSVARHRVKLSVGRHLVGAKQVPFSVSSCDDFNGLTTKHAPIRLEEIGLHPGNHNEAKTAVFRLSHDGQGACKKS